MFPKVHENQKQHLYRLHFYHIYIMRKRLIEYRKQFHGEKTRMKQACLILLFVAYFCPSVCSLTTFQQQFLDVSDIILSHLNAFD